MTVRDNGIKDYEPTIQFALYVIGNENCRKLFLYVNNLQTKNKNKAVDSLSLMVFLLSIYS